MLPRPACPMQPRTQPPVQRRCADVLAASGVCRPSPSNGRLLRERSLRILVLEFLDYEESRQIGLLTRQDRIGGLPASTGKRLRLSLEGENSAMVEGLCFHILVCCG